MKKKTSQSGGTNLPVSKQTAGGVTGAVIGSVIAGPVGAVVGAVAGTMMGNRAAKGQSLVSSETVKTARNAVDAVKKKVPSLKLRGAASKSVAPRPKTKAVKENVKSANKPGTSKTAAAKVSGKKAPAKRGQR